MPCPELFLFTVKHVPSWLLLCRFKVGTWTRSLGRMSDRSVRRIIFNKIPSEIIACCARVVWYLIKLFLLFLVKRMIGNYIEQYPENDPRKHERILSTTDINIFLEVMQARKTWSGACWLCWFSCLLARRFFLLKKKLRWNGMKIRRNGDNCSLQNSVFRL